MALFQSRKAKDEQAAPSTPTQTVEAMRRRAVHRLIGAAVLVVAGVIGFPLVFDNQPRPIPVDLPISIPDKTKVAPLATPPAAQPAAAASAAAPAAVTTATPPVVPAPVPTAPVATAPAKPEPKTDLKAEAKPAPKTDVKAEPKPEAKVDSKAEDARKAKALLEGKDLSAEGAAKPADGAGERFVVQVGAYTDAAKVREVRQKLESAGIKTYAQVVDTKDGSRTRVRVGPFADKAEATRTADKIRKLDLPVAILAL